MPLCIFVFAIFPAQGYSRSTHQSVSQEKSCLWRRVQKAPREKGELESGVLGTRQTKARQRFVWEVDGHSRENAGVSRVSSLPGAGPHLHRGAVSGAGLELGGAALVQHFSLRLRIPASHKGTAEGVRVTQELLLCFLHPSGSWVLLEDQSLSVLNPCLQLMF